MWPELFRISSFAIPSYGFLLAVGFVSSVFLLAARAPKFGIDRDAAADFGVVVLLAGLLGAKVLLVIVEWPRYLVSWQGVMDLMRAGGVFYGGFLGAVGAAAYYLHKKKLSFWSMADAAAPAVALGQAIGRLGCLAAGCCWGRECHEPWAITFTNPMAEQNVGVPLGIPLHPTQVYEAVGTFVLLFLLVTFEKRRFPGQTFASYLCGYAILRGVVEFFRGDPRGEFLGLMSTSQFIALLCFAAGAAVYVLQQKKPVSQTA
ncbi:MAG: prolipoprotein diacylglyceryl transferase [Acidobacteria bacterium]|nr:prolipoprotein diacylglyceryl transferase [Acidobacteriota bacterium]MCG3194373.1 Prolipoprotein diacylglyceryl transferase [Thermoanaerobaculia bacterium]MCK6682518.1 prolipoprotein diacylglyceryl transferase [Thermoanaerobaculia bacterium]